MQGGVRTGSATDSATDAQSPFKEVLPPPAPPQLPCFVDATELEAFRLELYKATSPTPIKLEELVDSWPMTTYQCCRCELFVVAPGHSELNQAQQLCDKCRVFVENVRTCAVEVDYESCQLELTADDIQQSAEHSARNERISILKRKREDTQRKAIKAKVIHPREPHPVPPDNVERTEKEQGNENKVTDSQHTGDDHWSGHVYQPELGLWLVNEEPKPKVRPDTPWPTPPHSARSGSSESTNHGATVDAEMLRLIEEPTITECIRGLHRKQKLEKRQKRNKKGIASIVRRIKSEDEEVIIRGLADLEKVLEEGRRQQLHKGAVQNETVVLFEICGGLERLEDLQTLNEERIWSPAMDLLETYFELVG